MTFYVLEVESRNGMRIGIDKNSIDGKVLDSAETEDMALELASKYSLKLGIEIYDNNVDRLKNSAQHMVEDFVMGRSF